MKKNFFCILGYPGSGKGVQSKYIAQIYGLSHIDIGEQLRKIARENSSLGKDTALCIHGEKSLVPDDLVGRVLDRVWTKDNDQGVIIDGAPRRLSQKSLVEQLGKERDARMCGVIFLSADKNKLLERIQNRVVCLACNAWYIAGKDVSQDCPVCPKCGAALSRREDDSPDGLKRRIQIFEEETLPVVEAYRKEGKLIEADANRSIEEVSAAIQKKLDPFFSEK